MEEVQRERKLVHEEMVRKYPIIAYLYVDTLFILFIIVTRNETILYKTIFSVRSSKHNFQFAAEGSKALKLETFSEKFVLNFKTIFIF